MDYKKYQNARDAAWRMLVRFDVRELPVRISVILAAAGCRLYSSSAGDELLRKLGLAEQMDLCDGFTVRYGARYFIFYDGKMIPGRIRFTLAHELGHIVLGHLREGVPSPRNREPAEGDPAEEQEANVFASRLLAPACVLHELGAVTPERIAELCDISFTAAQYRAGRLGVLETRGKFLSSPLEREVHRKFAEFIQRSKG